MRAAANRKLSALAITDHDTVSALAVARPEAERLGLELVSGVELTAERDGRELHLLGHFFDPENAALVAAVAGLRAARAERIERMVARLAELGLSVDLLALRRTYPRATIGRKHLADWLVRTGQVPGHRPVFDRYLGDGGPADVPKPRLPWEQAIALVRTAGGVAGLAHPPRDLNEPGLRGLIEGGLGSIEVAGPAIGKSLGLRLRAWAEKYGLVPIAGSDFHAPDRPGRAVGAVTTPAADLERLRAAAAGSRLAFPPPAHGG